MNHNVHEVEKKKRKFNRSFIKHLISSPHPLSLFLCPGNSDVDNDVVGCRLIRAMANRGKCHVVTRNNLQRGSNVLSLFFFFFSNISSTYFFSRRDETRLLTRGWHFFPRAAYLLRVCKPSHHFSSNELETKKYFSSFFFFFLHLNRSQTFYLRSPPPLLFPYFDGMEGPIVEEGIFFDALFIPIDISSIDVYCLFEKAVNFSRSRWKVELMESKQESWLTRIEKMKFVYTYMYMRGSPLDQPRSNRWQAHRL